MNKLEAPKETVARLEEVLPEYKTVKPQGFIRRKEEAIMKTRIAQNR